MRAPEKPGALDSGTDSDLEPPVGLLSRWNELASELLSPGYLPGSDSESEHRHPSQQSGASSPSAFRLELRVATVAVGQLEWPSAVAGRPSVGLGRAAPSRWRGSDRPTDTVVSRGLLSDPRAITTSGDWRYGPGAC